MGRSASGPTGSSWSETHYEQDASAPAAGRESVSGAAIRWPLAKSCHALSALAVWFVLFCVWRQALSFPEFSSSLLFQLPSSLLGDPPAAAAVAPPLLLASPTPDYLPADASPSAHSSASLIKAIREELRLLAQKQAVSGYP